MIKVASATTGEEELAALKPTLERGYYGLAEKVLEFEKNIDDFKNQKQQNEKIRNELSNFDEVLASLNNAIKITEENISTSKSSIDSYNKQIKQMEDLRDQTQAQAGFISGILAEYMSQILDFFDKYIQVRFVFWDSCFSGGANAALILQQTKQLLQLVA